nr:hypothetical protein [Phenylobacterium kunshanense]
MHDHSAAVGVDCVSIGHVDRNMPWPEYEISRKEIAELSIGHGTPDRLDLL